MKEGYSSTIIFNSFQLGDVLFNRASGRDRWCCICKEEKEFKSSKTCRFHCYLGLFIRYAPSYLCLMILTSKWLFKQQATPNSVFPLFQVMARTILNIGRQDKVTFYKYIIVLFK